MCNHWMKTSDSSQTLLFKKNKITLIDLYKCLCICSRALPLILLRPGSHIVNQRSGCSQPQLRQGTVIKLDGAMWKRHRALNALAGDNMSAMRTDHMGSPCLLGMPAALRHCGALCHLVSPKGEMRRSARSQWAVWEHVFLGGGGDFFAAHQRQSEHREGNMGSEIARCLIKTRRRLVWDAWSSLNKHRVSVGFQREFYAAKLYFMVLSLARLWNTSCWLLFIYLFISKCRCSWGRA